MPNGLGKDDPLGHDPAMTTLPYLPFAAGPFRLSMGLMSLKPEDWIEIDDRYTADMAERRRLLDTRRDEVFAALPEADAACREFGTLLLDHLRAYFPDIFGFAEDRLENRLTGESWPTAHTDRHPLDLAGRLVQEDFCILQSAGEKEPYVLTAACLCFPSRWRLADKIGRPMDRIHDPVPGYQDRLASPVNRFMSVLKEDKPVWRLNWSLYDNPALFQPTGHGRDEKAPGIDGGNAGERLHVRIERQTLRRLPNSKAVVFGIRVHQRPLASLAETPDAAARLASALREMPSDMARYKSLPVSAEAALAYLDRITEASAT
jgi:hypothetical protein